MNEEAGGRVVFLSYKARAGPAQSVAELFSVGLSFVCFQGSSVVTSTSGFSQSASFLSRVNWILNAT